MKPIKLLDKELPVKLEWLRSFLAVSEFEGFTNASKHLQLSQPAVSTHIRELEENLGVELFEKLGNRVRLSRAGEAIVGEARAIVQGVRHLRDMAVESETGVGGVLNVAASTTPGNYVLPRLLGEFERMYPSARTNLVIGNSSRVLERLLANQVDLAAVGIHPPADRFVARPLCEDEIVVFAPRRHPLARRSGPVPLADLARERFILREADSATRKLTEGWFASSKMAPAMAARWMICFSAALTMSEPPRSDSMSAIRSRAARAAVVLPSRWSSVSNFALATGFICACRICKCRCRKRA